MTNAREPRMQSAWQADRDIDYFDIDQLENEQANALRDEWDWRVRRGLEAADGEEAVGLGTVADDPGNED